jgi:hypothetical protein
MGSNFQAQAVFLNPTAFEESPENPGETNPFARPIV